jgi:4-carboxymuconolactone decarboxylase
MGEANIFTTLVRAPDLFRRWLPFGGALLRGALPARDRELLILRTAINCVAPYEWGQHVRIGRVAGLTDVEVARIAAGAAAPGWSADDALLLEVADELHERAAISEARYDALAARYDEVQLIEVPMVVGHYHLVAMTLNALRVANDEGLAPLPD